MTETLKIVKLIIFIAAIVAACIIQVLTYMIPPFSGDWGFWLQNYYTALFYIPMLLILITFPRPTSIKWQILVINILVACLILITMNVDFQVLRIFSFEASANGDIIWDKTHNLYWTAWMLQMSMVFLIFGIIYKLKTNSTWTAFRIGAVGPLLGFFSFEDIIYYPMHGRDPFTVPDWPWLPQHNIYFGRPVTTIELLWIVIIATTAIFLFLVIPALIRRPAKEEYFTTFSNSTEKWVFIGLIPLLIGAYFGFAMLYLNTNIINNQIPVMLLLVFAGIIGIFIVFSASFPKIESRFKQLVLIFLCYIIFWVAATEMDWHAVEGGFHLILPWNDTFWVFCDYRMAMWLIYLPVIILLISLMFKLIGNSSRATLQLSITNFLILIMGIDSICIFLIARGAFPENWTWGNLHYSIFDGIYSFPLLVAFALVIGSILVYIYVKNKIIRDKKP